MLGVRGREAAMRLLELFSGSGNLSKIARTMGWQTEEVDILQGTDIRGYETSRTYDLVWASPPCVEYSREYMPWSKTGKTPDPGLWNEALRFVQNGRYYCIENVVGAQKWHGKSDQHCGSRHLWTNLPPINCPKTCRGDKWKRGPHPNRAAMRARLPNVLCEAVLMAAERPIA